MRITSRLDKLIERANITAIGLSGEVTIVDESIAEKLKLKPLNWFECWLLRPYIEAEKKRGRQGFHHAVSATFKINRLKTYFTTTLPARASKG